MASDKETALARATREKTEKERQEDMKLHKEKYQQAANYKIIQWTWSEINGSLDKPNYRFADVYKAFGVSEAKVGATVGFTNGKKVVAKDIAFAVERTKLNEDFFSGKVLFELDKAYGYDWWYDYFDEFLKNDNPDVLKDKTKEIKKVIVKVQQRIEDSINVDANVRKLFHFIKMGTVLDEEVTRIERITANMNEVDISTIESCLGGEDSIAKAYLEKLREQFNLVNAVITYNNAMNKDKK